MNIFRPEVRTGVLVVVTLAGFVAAVLYLGAPGVFVPQNTYRIYVPNAAGIRPGAEVTLAGRRVGQVAKLYSPVPEKDRPDPAQEVLIEVKVERRARIYKNVKVLLTSNGLLGETLLDFTSGNEASGLADDGSAFLGERPTGIDQAVPIVLERLDPVLAEVTKTLESLQATSINLAALTAEGGEVQVMLSQFREVGGNLNSLTASNGPIRETLESVQGLLADDGKVGQALDNLTALIGPRGDLAKTLKNAETLTGDLANNGDIKLTLRNARRTTEQLNETIGGLKGQVSAVTGNLEQATDTLKRQPWRLIWPSTKRYGNETAATPKPRKVRINRTPRRD